LRSSLAYQVVVAHSVREQLRGAAPELRGYVAGVVALLRTDPSVGTAAFPVVRGPAYRTVVFPEGRGFLDYQVVEERRLVVLVDLTWP
jgi:hypothetical protein